MTAHPNEPIRPQEEARFEQFSADLRAQGRRAHTLKAYASDWRNFAQWYVEANGEPFDLSRLTALDLTDYREWAASESFAPTTINRRLSFLKQYATWGLEREVVKPTVYTQIHRVRSIQQQTLAPRSLKQADVRRLMKEVDLRATSRDRALLYLLLYTGLRVGEAAHLTIEAIQLAQRKGTLVIRAEHAKGGKQRRVPVPAKAREPLSIYLQEHPIGTGSVFVGQRGPLREDALARIVRQYAGYARLEAVTPHVLRHTFAYAYLKQTHNDLVGLADILGHDSVATTQLYTRKSLSALQDEIEKVRFY